MHSGRYRLLEDLQHHDRALRQRCERLIALAAAGHPVPPAAAWLLDNYAYIHGQVREIREAVPRRYFRDLPRDAGGEPRVYSLAAALVRDTEGVVDAQSVRECYERVQAEKPLTLAELWAIAPLVKLALIEALAAEDADETAIANAVTSLRNLETVQWRDLIESISVVERVLRRDPAGVYDRMEFESRDAYRHAVEAVARGSRDSEERVASVALDLAAENNDHIGHYLIGPGSREWRRRAGCRTPVAAGLRELLYRFPTFFYVSALALATGGLMAAVYFLLAPVPVWALALVALPASQAALSLVNPLVNLLVPPRRLPRMDFSEDIPDDCRTFVVVPTLLLSRRGVENLLENLEIHYLANRDRNLLFALLTDLPDADAPETLQDHLLDACVEGIHRLNQRHAADGREPFYLFHRRRQWNESEGVWMGVERKRGKLNDFNRYLLGEQDSFDVKAGDLAAIGTVRYVLTLDSDTQLPRDTARKLVATMAHPLNRPVIDERTGVVCRGYALMQPRISISMESAGRSHLARIFSGQTGFDPYTTAVSDVYQDLAGRASFTGKGIYDLAVFHRVLEGRFPDNTLLSHDLIEGEHVRTALVTDLELIDDYPATYEAWSKRKHRWVRGDWQIAMWLLPRVPDAAWRWRRNPLPLLSRWKIFDNLRRSLLEISFLALLVAGWTVLPGGPLPWTLIALALLAFPAYSDLLFTAFRVPPVRFWRPWLRECAFRFVQTHAEALFHLVFLAHQALAMADAVVRTLLRRLVTHRRLLEWESAAAAEASAGKGLSLMGLYLYASPAIALIAALLLQSAPKTTSLAMVALELWIFAPLIARWVNSAPYRQRGPGEGDTEFLRDLALRTWRYFADHHARDENWLVPDNFQEDPPAVAHVVSPTNLGLMFSATLAARDFGYLTTFELARRTGRMLGSIERMERCRGHFFNWYDTRTLQPIAPRYVSTVDSGNLAASLLQFRQGCLGLLEQPFVGPHLLAGLRDHCLRLRNALPPGERNQAIMRLVNSLLRQLEYQPNDLFYWESVLTEARETTRKLCDRIGPVADRVADWDEAAAAEIRYWSDALSVRLEASLAELYDYAPWLAAPFETELRLRSGDSTLADLFALLYRAVPLKGLPAQYDAIADKIREHLPAPGRPELDSIFTDLLRALEQARGQAGALIGDLRQHAAAGGRLVSEMDFSFLLDRRRKLIRIGYEVASGELDKSYYDLLASEARTAVFVAIAKGDLPREAWFHLGRKLTAWRGHRALLSWSGTMFEYLMPSLFMKTHSNTVLGESLQAVVRIQRIWARERGVPWGVSESAYTARDSALRYQYHAFGIPMLGVKRQLADDLVVAPYASMLALMVDRASATENLRSMAARGWIGRYGFYEAVDYSPRRSRGGEIVRCFMSHHQAMGLVALANVLLDGAMRERFHSEPMVQATEYLLQERLPALLDTTPEEQPLPLELVPAYRESQTAG